MDKIKAYLYALLVGFLNPYPARVAAAVAVLVVMANLTGMFAALKRGEKVSGSKISKGYLRIIIYFTAFSALYHALRDTFAAHLLSGIYSAIALHEFFLLLQKATELGIIPRGILKKLQDYVSKNTNDANSAAKI